MALTDETLRCMYCGKEHWSDPLYWYGNPSEPGVVCPECFRAGKTEPAGKHADAYDHYRMVCGCEIDSPRGRTPLDPDMVVVRECSPRHAAMFQEIIREMRGRAGRGLGVEPVEEWAPDARMAVEALRSDSGGAPDQVADLYRARPLSHPFPSGESWPAQRSSDTTGTWRTAQTGSPTQ